MLTRSVRVAALLLALGSIPASASAQASDLRFRSTSGRARMELSLDAGYGFSTEGDYLELASDFRAYAPFGLGVVLRVGAAVRWLSNAVAVDVGAAQRFDLVSGTHAGLQLVLTAGASVAYGPFDLRGDVAAYGGFGMVHLDLWTTNFFIGVGASAHAMVPELAGQGGRDAPILTITPLLRFGGDWGL